jgi:tetratricopeptide (TPR) repeat protein
MFNSNLNARTIFRIAGSLLFFAFLSLLLSACSKNGQGVKIRETEISIPTYLTGQQEEVPVFYTPENYQGAQMHIYPYAMIDSLSEIKTEKKYKALILENEFIEICLLPELGGRLYYAKDKTNGYDFFYHNHVIKPALIGMAGAWISGGVEWNIPHHHRVSTFMPVDYRLVENTDGSKSIWVGEFERRHQTKWNVGLTLYPGKSYIETKINLYNTTPLIQSFLIWANTAVHANENYQVVFPPDVHKAVFHSKVEFTDWPVSRQYYQGSDFTKGVDVSWWKNTTSPTSFFAWGSDDDFLAGIDHGKNAGVVLIGDHSISRGKKMWNWGNNDVAALWDKKLTDHDGTYLELMMGAYSDNQPDYSWNHPGFTKSASMYFYPVKGLTHIKEANREMAINLDIKSDSIFLQAYPTEKSSTYFLKLLAGKNEIIWKQEVTIGPSRPFSLKLKPGKLYRPEELEFVVLNSSGIEVISYQARKENNNETPEPYKRPESPEKIRSVDQLYLAGLRLEQFYNPDLDPKAYYLEALRRDSLNIMVRTQLGIYFLKKNSLNEAEIHLRKAVSLVSANYTVPKYAEPLYYLGICLMRQGKNDEAYQLLHSVSWSAEWLSPASLAIAKIECKKANLDHAFKHAQVAIQSNAYNIEATNLCTSILRHLGQYDKAVQLAQRALTIDPLDHFAFFELRLLKLQGGSNIPISDPAGEFRKIMRQELNNYLELAARYLESGFADDAALLLKEASSENEKLQKNPLILYYLAYGARLNSDSLNAFKFLQEAAISSVKSVFPYGYFTETVLESAVNANPSDGQAWYLLGNLLCDDQPGKAYDCWLKAAAKKQDLAMIYRNLAFLEANEYDQLPKALEHIDKAIALNPEQSWFRLEKDRLLEYMQASPEVRLAELRKRPGRPFFPDELYGRYLQLLTLTGQPDSAISGLSAHHFHGSEISDINYHDAWLNAQLLKGMQLCESGKARESIDHFNSAMEYPFNLENARDSKAGISLFLLARAYKLMHDQNKEQEFYKNMVNYVMPVGWGAGDAPEIAYFKALVARKLGNNKMADEQLKNLMKAANDMLYPQINKAEYSNSVKIRLHKNQALANANYMLALISSLQGNPGKVNVYIYQAMKYEPSHFGAKYFALLTRN